MKMCEIFSERLKELRKASNLTQAELAKKVSVSQQAVGLWESGKSMPHGEALNKLAVLFSVTMDDLLGREKCEYSALKERVERLEQAMQQLQRQRGYDEK